MARKWSAVTRNEHGVYETVGRVEDGPDERVMLANDELTAYVPSGHGDGMEWMVWVVDPAAALRLLAAEASDRLGCKWYVSEEDHTVSNHGAGPRSMWGMLAGGLPATLDDHFGYTSDELLACLHGSFLLSDAMKEGES